MAHESDRERGAAVVELAFVTAFLLIPLLIGLIDVGRMIYTRIALQEAAQEGVLYASFPEGSVPITAADITARVIESVSYPPLDSSGVSVYCELVPRLVDAAEVAVQVDYQIDSFFPFTGPVTISRTAVSDRFLDSCPAGSLSPLP